MYRIKTYNQIAQVGLDIFDGDVYTVSEEEKAPDAIVVRSAKLLDLEFNPELLSIARAGVGYNNIPTERCAEHGIVVLNTPGANAESVKELALCALFLSSRDLVGGIEWVKQIAGTDNVAAQVEKGKSAYVGPEILGKSLGVIGLGAIGARLASDALSLGMKVYGYDPYLSVDGAWALASGVRHVTDLNELYKNCDYITIHIPYLTSTHHFISSEWISKMKPGVRLINLARAELVDEDAVLDALNRGVIASYVTDFPNDKTAGAPGVVAIPHLGASTPESEENCAIMAARQTREYLENGNIINSVNMPRAVLARSGYPRVCVIHENVPNMIAKMTAILSDGGANIENMLNAGRKDLPHAYTLLDLNRIPEGLEEAIAQTEGVVRVRVIR